MQITSMLIPILLAVGAALCALLALILLLTRKKRALRCPSCGQPIQTHYRVCPYCGAPLNQEVQPHDQ